MQIITVYIIQAYDYLSEDGVMKDVVTLELISKSVDEAMKKAKKIIKKKGYRLSQVIEKEIC